MKWQIIGQLRPGTPEKRRQQIRKILLKNRHLKTEKEQQEFFNPPLPHDLTLKAVGLSAGEIKKALKRIKEAIKKEEKVIVYGDYDTDGICATAIAWEALDRLGVKALPFIPKREEGYGLKVAQLERMAKEGVKLVVTVDQGIVHSRQVKHARKLGIDVIITDHHEPGKKIPPALAVIHTLKLAGAGVAWFFAKEIQTPGVEQVQTSGAGKDLGLDLAAIGTIADMVPLLGPNRCLVKHGLAALRTTPRLGLLALCDFAAIDSNKIGPYEAGFIIGPRLNAAGRMDDPMASLRLVCTRDQNRAIALAQEIDQQNRERQDLMRQTTRHARQQWLSRGGREALIFVYHQTYEHGVIGLVASRLKDEFSRPAVVLGPRGNHWVASARSVGGFNIVEAIRAMSDIIGDHGGHKLAAGFSVSGEKLAVAGKRLLARAEEELSELKLMAKLKIDAEISLNDVSEKLFRELERFQPFGQKNPQPLFASRGIRVLEARSVGKGNRHLKLRLASSVSGSQRVNKRLFIDAIAFNLGHLASELSPNQPVDIAYNLLKNEWNGEERLQLKVRDIKKESS